MPDPRLLGIGCAVPRERFPQGAVYEDNPFPRHPLLERFFLQSAIQTRAMFVPPRWHHAPRSRDETTGGGREGALASGAEARADVWQRTNTPPERVGMFGVTTVTGYTTPGLDLLLARQLGLPTDLARVHFNCIGCHAAVPLLRVAADHVARRPQTRAVALAVEICSACYAPVHSAQNAVAVALFGDGCAAAMIGTDGEGPALVDFGSANDFEHMDALGFELSEQGFHIILDPTIPQVIAAHIGQAVDTLLARNGVAREQVSTWCFHPGGAAILDRVQATLGLSDPDMQHSRRVLRAYGNMSSPSVLFVLSEAMRSAPPPAGSYGVMAAFGPGLGIESALLEFR